MTIPSLTFFLEYFGVSSIIFFTLVALILINWLQNHHSNLPPGPQGLPIVGYLPYMKKMPHLEFNKLSKKYGDIMSVKILWKNVIHLNGYAAIREAYLEKREDFMGRPQDASFFQWLLEGKGIIQSEGPVWKEHRRFALHTLRDFGFGKLSLEDRILDIAKELLERMEKFYGQPQDVASFLSACTANVICSLMFDKHYKMEDPQFLEIRQQIKTLIRNLSVTAFIGNPLMRFIPWKWIPGYSPLVDVKKKFYSHMGKIIQELEDNFDPSNLRNYSDVFLEQRRLAEESGTLESSTFTKDRLIAIALNLFIAGTESTSITLYWALKLLMAHPEIQERIEKELDEVVGRDRLPSWMDRSNLPYTEATIMEVQRIASIAPIIPVHSNPEETILRGYTIPKRSIILANLWSVLRDPSYFPNPDMFDPSRFLNKEGKLERKESFIPFGIGKRVCLGESLAKMELFLFFTSVVHRFRISPPVGEKADLQHINPFFISSPLSYKLCATVR